MARFPIDDSKLPGLGEALARAVNDPVARQELENNTSAYLISAGVDQDAIKGLTFTVVSDTGTNLNLVIPSAINQQKVDDGDGEYLTALGNSVVLTCAF